MPEDTMPTPGNAIEQGQAALRDLAQLAGSYYKSLIDENIPDDLAYGLVMDYMRNTFSAARDQGAV